jgi:hypothetical protein
VLDTLPRVRPIEQRVFQICLVTIALLRDDLRVGAPQVQLHFALPFRFASSDVEVE